MIHSSLSEYSLVVHFCPWHCFLSSASWELYSLTIIYRRDSSSPSSMPPAVCQCSSSCLSPRNSITFLLPSYRSTFLTAHPLCRSRAPSYHLEDFPFSVHSSHLHMETWILKGTSPKIYFFRLSNLGQHWHSILLWYKNWFFIHPNRKPYYFLSW